MESFPSLESVRLDIEELSQFISTSKRANVKRQLEEYKKNLELLLKQEEQRLKKQEEAKTKETSTSSTESKTEDIPKANIYFQTITKYALDTSSDDYVKIYLTEELANLKTIDPNNIKVKFTKRTFDAYIFNWNKKNYRFSCFNLCKDINPEKCKATATSSGLVIRLAKANSGDHWDSLEKKKGLLDKNDEEEDGGDKTKDKDPNASLMEMMRDMYQNGDPEMKKMIAEAWTKSQNEQMKDKK
jgi:calcyclin binding protein